MKSVGLLFLGEKNIYASYYSHQRIVILFSYLYQNLTTVQCERKLPISVA